LKKEITEAFSGFGGELLENIRSGLQERLEDAAFEERIIGIENATAAMLEAQVETAKIEKLLVKYWDLRPSEAMFFIDKISDRN